MRQPHDTAPPRPVLILWHPEEDGNPEPVAIVAAANAQRKLADYNADSPHLGTHTLAELSARPLTWDDYHSHIDDYVTPALCRWIADEFGVTCDIENTGGGCNAIHIMATINGNRVDVLITELEDAHAPLLGWTRGIAVGFYDPETGDMIADGTHNYGSDGYDLSVPAMTAEEIADALADAMAAFANN